MVGKVSTMFQHLERPLFMFILDEADNKSLVRATSICADEHSDSASAMDLAPRLQVFMARSLTSRCSGRSGERRM